MVTGLEETWVNLLNNVWVLFHAIVVNQTLRGLTHPAIYPSLNELRVSHWLHSFRALSCTLLASCRSHEWAKQVILGKFFRIKRCFGRLANLTHGINSSILFLYVSFLRQNTGFSCQSLILSWINDQRAVINGLACELLAQNRFVIDQTVHHTWVAMWPTIYVCPRNHWFSIFI